MAIDGLGDRSQRARTVLCGCSRNGPRSGARRFGYAANQLSTVDPTGEVPRPAGSAVGGLTPPDYASFVDF